MKVPKTMRIYCPYCKKHTEHTIKIQKPRKRGELKQGQRRFRRKLKGYRGYPRPKPKGEKSTRRRDVRYICSVCKKMHTKSGFRVKSFEIV
ncbi:MAG: 50S ribosomal protein L44e [Methanomicrobia archaeon]|nr:50S ribosomal protein L44e [Methanomicrobia archaeon]